MHDKLEACLKDWSDLALEYEELENKHKDYRQVLEKCISMQKKCLSDITHQKYRLNVIKKLMKEVEPSGDEEKGELDDLEKDIQRRQSQLNQMMESLPKQSGRYLRVIMGNIDVSILDKNEKYKYKEQYESFKLIMTLIGGLLASSNFFLNYRILDLVFMFLIVWYYCTLTIRESILKVNGSRIKGWWRLHHFISCVVGGVLLVWPDGPTYREFRDVWMLFNVYVAFIQYLQFVYQKGCLYRLRCLGERQDMDITIDGFHSWMWKGLGFLLPFLYLGYLMQLYNAYTLYLLSFTETATWQVPALSGLFLLLGVGNIVTVSMTIPKKWADSKSSSLKYKFIRLDKYFWSHRRRRTSVSQANPKFSERVEGILRRTGSVRLTSPAIFTKDNRANNNIEEMDETNSQTSDEVELHPEDPSLGEQAQAAGLHRRQLPPDEDEDTLGEEDEVEVASTAAGGADFKKIA